MNMNRVNEIIKKHNDFLDSMTEKERIDYYAGFGLVSECEPSVDNDSTAVVHGISKKPNSTVIGYRASSQIVNGRQHGNRLPGRYSRNSAMRRGLGPKKQKFKVEKV